MAKHITRTVSAIAAAGLLMTSVVVAVASLPRDAVSPAVTAWSLDQSRNMSAAPVGGSHLFGENMVCVQTEHALLQLDAERNQVGGETVILDKGLDQAFADTWRHHADQESVPVSAVLAHVVGSSGEGVVDVIEFDETGCAMTRTVLGLGDWGYLLKMSIDTDA